MIFISFIIYIDIIIHLSFNSEYCLIMIVYLFYNVFLIRVTKR